MQSSMKLGEAIYKAQQDGEAQPGAEAGHGDHGHAHGKADDGVVDADFEEVESDKKDK